MRLLYKNVYKYNQVTVQGEDTLIIDNNAKVAKRLEYLEELMQQKAEEAGEEDSYEDFSYGLSAEEADILTEDGEEGSRVIKANAAREQADMAEVSAKAQQMIKEAEAEAEEIKEKAAREAEIEAEQLKNQAFEDGRNEGYQAGYEEGMTQIEKQRQSLEEERKRLMLEYDDILSGLEPKFIELLTDIYEKIFYIDLSGEKEIAAHLLSAALHKIDGSSSYFIHVSPKDYSYVLDRKEELLENAVRNGSSIEIVEDRILAENQCMIETESGIFDCGMDTQLEELSKKLKLLSYIKE